MQEENRQEAAETAETKRTQVVKSKSKAYGYNYASLADIVNQGFEIPKMVTRIVEGERYIFWYDKELGEWLQGAPLIVPEMRGMNAAQAMGSALTYARRYTAQMALGLACDDDAKLEKIEGAPAATGRTYNRPVNANKNHIDFRQVREKIREITTVDELLKYWSDLKLTDGQAKILKSDFGARRNELEGLDNGVE